MAGQPGLRGKIQSLDASLTLPLTLSPGRGLAQLVALGLAHSGDSFVWAGLCALAWFLGDAQWKIAPWWLLRGSSSRRSSSWR